MKSMVKITDDNFHEHFFDARKHRPKNGQVLAKFTAIAEFIDGKGKRDVIHLLKMDKAHQAAQVMKKIHGAKEPDCYRICREMAEDLLMTSEVDVENKPYEYVIEHFYYTQKELVPQNLHWELIRLINYDEESGEYKSQITV